MKSISIWASRHRNLTRLIITLFSFIAGFLAFFFGIDLYANGISISMLALNIAAITLILPFLFYPTSKQKKHNVNQYLKKRMFSDALIYGIAFFLFTGFGNHRAAYWDAPITTNQEGNAVLIANTMPAKLHQEKKQKRSNKKIIRKQFKKAIKFFKTKKEGGNAGRFFLYTLLLAAIGTGLLALGCSIACSSGSGLGAVLMILGLGAWAAGAVFLVLAIIAAIKGQ